MPQLINLTQNTHPLDHTTVAVEMTLRELIHLTQILGCTGQDVTEGLGMYSGDDSRVAGLYTFLTAVVGEATAELDFDLDEHRGPRLVFEHDHTHDESEPF